MTITVPTRKRKTILIRPKITLFAFQLCKELTKDKFKNAKDIWVNLSEVGKLLNFDLLQELPQLMLNNDSLSSNRLILARDERIPKLLVEGAFDQGLIAPKGNIHIFRLSDTHFIDVTIFPAKDCLCLSSLSKINPNGCLFPSSIDSSLGQTLLFFSQIADSNQNTEEFAREIVAKLIANSDRSNVDNFSLVEKGILLRGTVYEFTEYLSDPRKNIQILVWLSSNQFTLEQEKKGYYYEPLIQLLCAQKKIQFAYYQAREKYKDQKKVYSQIEPIAQEFSHWNLKKGQWLQTELKDLIKKTHNNKQKKALQELLNKPSTEVNDLEANGLIQRIIAYLQQAKDRRVENTLKELSQQQLQILQRQQKLKILIEKLLSNQQKQELKKFPNKSSTDLNNLEANHSGECIITYPQQHDDRRLENKLKELSQQQLESLEKQENLKVLIEEILSSKQKKEPKESSNESSSELTELEANELIQRVTVYLEKHQDRRLEQILKQLSQRQLESLEKRLVQIPTISVNYDLGLRDIKLQITTIQSNRINYQNALKQLQNLQPHTDDLGFLNKFITEDCPHFEKQIQYDLKYLASGKELFQPTINSINNLVNIQVQKRQTAKDLAEKERDRSIQVWVAVVASGLAVSSLSSNAMPKPIELFIEKKAGSKPQQTWYNHPFSLLTANIFIHVAIGIVSAILVGIIATKLIRFLSDRVRQR